MVNEREIFDEWRFGDAREIFERLESNIQDNIFELSPTPDEAIDSNIFWIENLFDIWLGDNYPEVEFERDDSGAPVVLVNYLDRVFDMESAG